MTRAGTYRDEGVGGNARERWTRGALILGGLALALALRWSVRDYVTGDVQYWVSYWYAHLKEFGLAGLRTEIPAADGWENLGGAYPPSYYYLIWIATRFDGLAPSLYLIKAVSVAFDFLAAFFAYRIASLHPSATPARSWLAFLAVLLAPTLILNSAFWGQCDAIHVSLLLGAIYFALRRRPLWVLTFFTLALSIKAQAVFLLPFLLLLLLRGRVRWAHLALVPLVYVIVMLPAVAMGRPPIEILRIYLNQGQFLSSLSLNAANPWYFVDDRYYVTGVVIGTVVTVVASLLYALRAARVPRPMTNELVLLCATFSLALAPFLLPKMHDRYFLAADLASIVLAVRAPRLWWLAVGFQITSVLAYIPVVSDTITNFGGEVTRFMPVAAVLNIVLLAAFTWLFIRRTAVRT